MNLSVNYGKSFFSNAWLSEKRARQVTWQKLITSIWEATGNEFKVLIGSQKREHITIFSIENEIKMQIRQKTLQLEKEDDPNCKYVRCRKKHSFFFGKGVRVLQNWMSICFAILVQIVSYGQQIDQSQGENRLIYMINLSVMKF